MQAHHAACFIVRIDDGFDGRTAFDLLQRRFDLLMAVTRNDDYPVRTQVIQDFQMTLQQGFSAELQQAFRPARGNVPPDACRGLRRGLLLSCAPGTILVH